MKVIVGGLAVEYMDEGNGPVMLFLHGWGQDATSFNSPISVLANKFRIIRPDLPGFGGSELPKVAWGVHQYADFLQQFLNKLNTQPEVVIGHSLGGQIAVKALADGLIKPKKLILIGAAVIRESHQSPRNKAFAASAKVGKAITSLPGLRRIQPLLRRQLYTVTGNNDYNLAGAMKPTFLKITKQDLQNEASLIVTPTLIIWGDKDTETPIEQGRRLAYLIKGSTLEVFSGGHFIFDDQSERVAAAIERFADA
ncbi:MAG TPA: alpha/beta hydrolase [Candidatus Nanoarchaeia archaeon]|nr:alpha/beta hydrolase [Candidatus Nanoarchaeia archaeon]